MFTNIAQVLAEKRAQGGKIGNIGEGGKKLE